MSRELVDSAVEWIGKMPANWKLRRVGNLFEQRSEKVSDIEYEPLSVTKNGIVKQLETAAKSNDHTNRKKVCVNDFVINSRSDRKMSSGVSPLYGSVSLINIVLHSRNMDPSFVNYLLKNYGFAEEFYRWGTGIVEDLWSTNYSRMKKILIPTPGLEEQKKIANLLDDKVSKINNITDKLKRSIEELKKYKQSLITEAVTKGLYPDIEMKESGINWVGSIPKHWGLSYFKYEIYIRARLGWKGLKAHEYVDKGIAFLSTPNIKGESIDFNHVNYITRKRYDESPEIKLSKDDVLLTKDGSTLGTVNVVRSLFEDATVNSSIAVLTPSVSLNAVYLYYLIKSDYIQNEIRLKKDGMGVPHLFQKDIRQFRLILPPLDEQIQISTYLDGKIQSINLIINNKDKLIFELEDYKKSLIYEYVTGKKEVM
ncbi:restriction endonuclease subunit S [Gracilibacillus salinarum]|uniref:Restriction endonuclease subunit S n=1 Tax=Gracilibacillus salinarum TaxID=2932255 RepID=A0ABY4GJ48_9BACI|nr:restriction endonuclease subunit S [Gracilibacillus salinarum]UOQ84020.1 restriction endonuclease subunit S [Gracilibacillus salinarum]